MKIRLLSAFALLLTFSSALGCASSSVTEDFCERITAAGCALQTGRSCEDQFGSIEERADDRGCSSEFKATMECSVRLIEKDGCEAGQDVESACASESDALARCDAR